MDDLISRQAAIDALEEPRKVPDTWTDEYAVGERMQWEKDVKALSSLPSSQPERKKGKWINHRNDNGHNIADCSECGNALQWFDGDEKPKFCCMCGADMREREDE